MRSADHRLCNLSMGYLSIPGWLYRVDAWNLMGLQRRCRRGELLWWAWNHRHNRLRWRICCRLQWRIPVSWNRCRWGCCPRPGWHWSISDSIWRLGWIPRAVTIHLHLRLRSQIRLPLRWDNRSLGCVGQLELQRLGPTSHYLPWWPDLSQHSWISWSCPHWERM